MKMKWSPSVQGFFSENNSDIPDDAFDIEDALYYELMNGQSTGKIIINNPDNLSLIHISEPTRLLVVSRMPSSA